MAMHMNVIVYRGVVKSFGGVTVLKNVDIDVGSDEIVALLGPNGSGKSTLFKMSIGVVKPDSGFIRVGGIDPVSNPVEARRAVGYLPEEPLIYESLFLEEYLSFVLSVYGAKASVDEVRSVVRALGLEEHMGKFMGELSYGNKRKAMIAIIILRDPKILVLDEVFSGLDVASAKIVRSWLEEKRSRGTAIIFSTHVVPIAEAVADRIVVINNGEIVVSAKPNELKDFFKSQHLEDVYLRLTGYRSEYEEIIRALAHR